MTSHSTDAPLAAAEVPSECRFRISIANETESVVDEARLIGAVQFAFEGADYDDVSVSIAIVSDATIHDLNRQFLAHDYPTDVLSFPLDDSPPLLEGEIVVSVDTARQGASEAGWAWENELLLYVVHGALHLAGYGDKSSEAAEAMRAEEAAVLGCLGVTPSATDSRWAAHEGEPSP